MASFAAQAALRSKWTDLVDSSSFEVPEEVTTGVKNVVGWLKQVNPFIPSVVANFMYVLAFVFPPFNNTASTSPLLYHQNLFQKIHV